MKLVLALTALIVVAQGQDPVEAMKIEARIMAATDQFCKDVASGNDEAAWADVDKALDFECVSYALSVDLFDFIPILGSLNFFKVSCLRKQVLTVLSLEENVLLRLDTPPPCRKCPFCT